MTTPSTKLQRDKGLGESEKQNWSLLNHDVSLPAAIIYQSKLHHNLQWMQTFADNFGVKIAPHGKTTMSPELFSQQMHAGAWGMTLATATQVSVAAEAGIPRVILANQLVGRRNMEIISRCLAQPNFEFYCLVDSKENILSLANFFADKNQNIQVLLELGVNGARCGVRNKAEAEELIEDISHHSNIHLAGIETYEGVIKTKEPKPLEIEVRRHIKEITGFFLELVQKNVFSTSQIVLTGAGSAWYDIVAESFSHINDARVLPIIRPGCYLVHDHGLCDRNQKALMSRIKNSHELSSKDIKGDLLSALEIWAYVQSLPEPGLAIVAMGKRDVAFDADYPKPLLHYRDDFRKPQKAQLSWKVVSMMDQHTTLKINVNDDIKVGDMLAFGTSHPCLTFDKWRKICLIDDDYQVLKTIDTFF